MDLHTQPLPQKFINSGVFEFHFIPPADSVKLQLEATFNSSKYGEKSIRKTLETITEKADSDFQMKLFFSPRDRLVIGEYAILHLKKNFETNYLYWFIMSKNLLLHGGREPGETNVVNIPVVISSEMAPGFTMFAFALNSKYEIISG